MTSLIELPPNVKSHRRERRIPGRIAIAVVVALALGLGVALTLTASDRETVAETTKDDAITTSDITIAACDNGNVPPQFVVACDRARGTRDRVEAIAGPIGPKGDTGTSGPAGPSGLTGASGAMGVPGPKGETGDPGANGVDGSNGQVGPMGPKGDTGATGERGEDGEPPAGWTTNYPDGSTEQCSRVPEPEFDPAAPRYDCTVSPPDPDAQ